MDIGCCSFCLLGIITAESSSNKVYVIETSEGSFKRTKRLIFDKSKNNNVFKNIELMNEYSLNLKDIKRKIIVHEIISECASSDGVYAVINVKKRQ